MTFSKDKWYICPDIDTAPVALFGDIKKLEKKARGGEFAMVGQHISRAIHVLLLIEQGISDMSPFEYFKLIREINKEEFSGIVEIFARERMIGEQDCAEFDFQGKFNGLDMTMRWLVFLRNNYACQLRIGVPTVLYQGRKVEIENLLDSVSFPVNKKLLPLKKDPRIREYRKALESTKKVGDPYLIAWFVVNNFTTKFLFNP